MGTRGAGGLETAQFAEVARGAALEVSLVTVETVEGFRGRFVEEGSAEFVLSLDDFAQVPGGAHVVVEGLELEEAGGEGGVAPIGFAAQGFDSLDRKSVV